MSVHDEGEYGRGGSRIPSDLAVMKRSAHQKDAAAERPKAERVYRYLRNRIRELELPPGARVEKNEIAQQCGVSRAPVSEAIARLAADGLVDVFPQSGSFVAPIRAQDIRESMMIRMGLEVEAVALVTAIATPALFARLDANLAGQASAVRAGNMQRLDDLDEDFHAIILGELKVKRVQRLVEAARAVLDRPRFQALPAEGRPKATLNEHRRIVDAMRTRDPAFAAAAMCVHLARVLRAIEGHSPSQGAVDQADHRP